MMVISLCPVSRVPVLGMLIAAMDNHLQHTYVPVICIQTRQLPGTSDSSRTKQCATTTESVFHVRTVPGTRTDRLFHRTTYSYRSTNLVMYSNSYTWYLVSRIRSQSSNESNHTDATTHSADLCTVSVQRCHAEARQSFPRPTPSTAAAVIARKTRCCSSRSP